MFKRDYKILEEYKMSVKVEKTENKDELKLEFTVEAKVFEEAMKKVFTKNAKYFNIPGFRKVKHQ